MIRIVTVYGNDTVTISIIYRHHLFLCVRRVKSKHLSLEKHPYIYCSKGEFFNLGIMTHPRLLFPHSGWFLFE